MIHIRHVDQLLQRHDRDFIVAAYNALLGREPDDAGLDFYLQRIRAGHDRVLLLAELAGSDEAKLHGPSVEGLAELLARREVEQRRLLRSLRRDHSPQLNRIENLLARVHADLEGLAPTLQAWTEAGADGPRPPLRACSSEAAAGAAQAPEWAALLPWPGQEPDPLARLMGRPAPAAPDREGDGCTF